MSLTRIRKPTPLICSPRSALPDSAHPQIDSILKDLRACSRRLQTALATHRDELQILERLYYKGKNQHRSAVFWQRVVEMRRFGGRLAEMNLGAMVEILRCSFWGNAMVDNPKALKGAWTHWPNTAHVQFILERLLAACALVDETRNRLREIYRLFTLAMRTSYFLQLVLTLAAIAARLNTLMDEVRTILEDCWTAGHSVVAALDPQAATRLVSPIKGNAAGRGRESVRAPQQMVVAESNLIDEDTGCSVVATASIRKVSYSEGDVARVEYEKLFGQRTTVQQNVIGPLDNLAANGSQSFIDAAVQRGSDTRATPRAEQTSKAGIIVAKRKPESTAPEVKATKKTKRSKKKDEIDDIFAGF